MTAAWRICLIDQLLCDCCEFVARQVRSSRGIGCRLPRWQWNEYVAVRATLVQSLRCMQVAIGQTTQLGSSDCLARVP